MRQLCHALCIFCLNALRVPCVYFACALDMLLHDVMCSAFTLATIFLRIACALCVFYMCSTRVFRLFESICHDWSNQKSRKIKSDWVQKADALWRSRLCSTTLSKKSILLIIPLRNYVSQIFVNDRRTNGHTVLLSWENVFKKELGFRAKIDIR